MNFNEAYTTVGGVLLIAAVALLIVRTLRRNHWDVSETISNLLHGHRL